MDFDLRFGMWLWGFLLEHPRVTRTLLRVAVLLGWY